MRGHGILEWQQKNDLFSCLCAAGTFLRQSGKKVDRRLHFFMLFGFEFNDEFKNEKSLLTRISKWIYYSTFFLFVFFLGSILLNRNERKPIPFGSLCFIFFLMRANAIEAKFQRHDDNKTYKGKTPRRAVTAKTTIENKILLSKQIGFMVSWVIFFESLFFLIGAIRVE